MDKRIFRHIITSVLAFAIIFCGVILVAGPAQADTQTERPKVSLTTLWAGYDNDLNLFAVYEGKTDDMKITSIKSSNAKVIGTKKSGSSVWDVSLIPKKAGKCTVTVKYKLDGKAYTDKIKMTVRKFPKELKSLTAGGKTINLKTNKYNCDLYKYSKKTGSVKAKASKGWKITGVLCMLRDNPDDMNDISIKTYNKSYAAKGKSIKFPNKYNTMLISIGMENSKGEWLEYVVYFHRGSKK